MPCYRCGTRQSDPERGPSAWQRAVRNGQHVLVCPQCQQAGDWTEELDRCPVCASTVLARLLGETTCRACGAVLGSPAPPGAGTGAGQAAGASAGAGAPGLADEVAAAIERVLRAGPG